MNHPDRDLPAHLEPALALTPPSGSTLRARPRSRLVRASYALAALAVAAFAFHLAVNLALNGYVRPRLERSFAARQPGAALRLGTLRYDFWRDRLRCESLHLARPGHAPFSTGALSVAGVHWTGLLAETPDHAKILQDARLDIADLAASPLTLAGGEYHLRCARLHISVPAAEIALHGLTLRPTVDDEAFFAADPYRRIRYHVAIADVAAHGVDFGGLLAGRAYRADSLEIRAPQFESYVNREKPRRPPARIPPMPHEMLAAVDVPLALGRLTVTGGSLRILGRRFAGAEPGVLTFTDFGLTARGIANVPAGGEAIEVQASTRLMDAALLTVDLSLPVAPESLAYRYSGKLAAMDLTRLNGYLSGTGSFEIKTGRAEGAEFSVEVVDGHARGLLKGVYRDLHVTVLDRETGADDGVVTRVATVLANQIKVRHENTPDTPGAMTDGKIDYARTPEDTFLQFSWAALRTGISDLLTVM